MVQIFFYISTVDTTQFKECLFLCLITLNIYVESVLNKKEPTFKFTWMNAKYKMLHPTFVIKHRNDKYCKYLTFCTK